jgi:hypothetical protein
MLKVAVTKFGEQKRMIHIFILQVLERVAVAGLAGLPVIMRQWLYFLKLKNNSIEIVIFSSALMYSQALVAAIFVYGVGLNDL